MRSFKIYKFISLRISFAKYKLKKLYFIFFLLFTVVRVFSQTIAVVNISNNTPISKAFLFTSKGLSKFTNESGFSDMNGFSIGDTINIRAIGYYTSQFIYSGENTTIRLKEKAIYLDEVVLSANRSEESYMDVPNYITIIKSKDIEFYNQPNTADLMQQTGQVYVQKSQLGGGSPVIRGFEANKILLVVDGVRMNNAIYRGGHLQDIITIDQFMLDRVEVLQGPSSSIYGSDALGGVIHFYTKDAKYSNTEKFNVSGSAMARYSSAMNEKTGNLHLNLGWKKIATYTNISFSEFGDLQSGRNMVKGYSDSWLRRYYIERINGIDSTVSNPNPSLQKGSSYSQIDMVQKINFKIGVYSDHKLNFQYSTSSFVPRYDRLSGDFSKDKFRFAENGYGPQQRLFASYTFDYKKHTLLWDEIKTIIAFQKIDQDRITRLYRNPERKIQEENLSLFSFNIDAFKLTKGEHEIRYGFELTYNDVNSKAQFINIKSGAVRNADTRYADGGNSMFNTSAYISHSWELNKYFVLKNGIRYTFNRLNSDFVDSTFFDFPFKNVYQNNQAISGNIGIVFKQNDKFKIGLVASTGFRSPNLDDMSKVFESSGKTVIVPNPYLEPEYTYNFELNIQKLFNNKYLFEIGGYYSYLTNIMVVKNFQLNNEDSALYNGVTSKVQALQNADRGYIYGCFAKIELELIKNLKFATNINYTLGRYINLISDIEVPLDHIPPVYGFSNISYRYKNLESEIFVRFNGKKQLKDYSPSGEDNLKYATKDGMPSWYTLNLRLSYGITSKFKLSMACENLMDVGYRSFASGINAPGRNLIIGLRYSF